MVQLPQRFADFSWFKSINEDILFHHVMSNFDFITLLFVQKKYLVVQLRIEVTILILSCHFKKSSMMF